jgi:hypothetical protein
MLFIVSLVVRVLARLLVLSAADEATKDLEILVLRQQLRVLRRHASRPRFTPLDRALLAAASRALPTRQWTSVFLVTPQTLLRWHRDLVRHKWTYQKGAPAWPATDQCRGRRARAADGQGEPTLGCVRICGELRKLGIRGRHDHQVAAATTRAGPSAAALRADLDAVSQSPGRGDRGVRLPHGGDDLAVDPVRVVLHPGQYQTGRGGRCHGPVRLKLGHPAGQERHDEPERSGPGGQAPAPRSRRQVHSSL